MRLASPAQLIDVGPSLLELCGVDAPEGIAGRSLVPSLENVDSPADEEREHVAEIVYGDAYWSRSLTRGALKLIVSRLGSREAVQLFDVRADPEEMKDLAAAEPVIVAAMRARLEAIVAAAEAGAPPGETAEFDPVTRERLKALGYVQ
jgi:arylsulfatase A-like enzyme